MTIDRKAFWTDVASGLVLAAIVPFRPRIVGLIVLGFVFGMVLLFVVDMSSGGSSLSQLAERITELFGSRQGGR